MKGAADLAIVETVKDRCRTCYQCVRECPAKAIRIFDGQAEVMAERCIACHQTLVDGMIRTLCHRLVDLNVKLSAPR